MMDAIKVCSVLVLLLPYCVFGSETADTNLNLLLEDETNARLAKIEAVLETVLETNAELARKNDQLERRVETLEEENRRLKAEQASSSSDDETVGDRTAEGIENNASQGQLEGKPNLRKRADKVPRYQQLKSYNKQESCTVAFTATVSRPHVTNLGIGQTVLYDRVITNEGGAYHNRTGIFTAPVSGVYVFNVDTMIDTGNSEYLMLVMDGNEIVPSFTHGAKETHLMTSSRTTTARVNAGSDVWVKTFSTAWHGNGTIHGNNYSSFSGWLLACIE